jgi:hypothetical protein
VDSLAKASAGRRSFLKKRTKKLLFLCYTLPDKSATASKSFLLLFFKKEALAFHPPAGA